MANLILADDNLTTQRVFELALFEEDIEMSHFENAQSAVDFAQENPPDLVFAHIDIPELGGYELSRRIKSSAGTADATVVMLGGAFQVFDTVKAKECGCIHYLSKPFETSKLLELIRDLLENPPRIELPKPRFLFEIPLRECLTQTVFDLESSQCSAAWRLLGREVASPGRPDFAALSRQFPAGFGAEDSDAAAPPPGDPSPAPPSDAA